MNYFDDELKIIEKVQNLETESVLLATSSDEEAEVFQSIYNSDKWKDWINSSVLPQLSVFNLGNLISL